MKIMLCYNQTEAAQAALKVAEARAKKSGASVFVVTSMTGGVDIPKEEFDTRKKELARIRKSFVRQGIVGDTELSVRGLEAGEDLVRWAHENEIDEIIIGIRRVSKVGKMIFGSTAQHVILRAPCPVLTVKP